LFKQLQGVVERHAEIANRRLKLGMSKQELARAEIVGPLVDEGDRGAAQTVGAEERVIEPDEIVPRVEQARIMAGGHWLFLAATATEQPIAIPHGAHLQPPQQSLSRRLRQFEHDRPAGRVA
jgi:hypothetical protein